MPKVVSIHSYRGGTGKSNFTANLATTVALQGYRVGVVDTDVPSPGIHNLFCLEPEQTYKTLDNYKRNLQQWIEGGSEVDEMAEGGTERKLSIELQRLLLSG
jgi:MinD-like ATPase involved in chromosome partitioning or flagellar assembly